METTETVLVAPPLGETRIYERAVATIEVIDPMTARDMVATTVLNRPLSDGWAMELLRRMVEGLWMLNGEAIIFDWFGRLVQGQHRLTACMKSGISFETVVVRGVDPACFPTYDNHKARSIPDVLRIKGEVNTQVLATSLRLIWRWEFFLMHQDELLRRKESSKKSKPRQMRLLAGCGPDAQEISEALSAEFEQFLPINLRWGTPLKASPIEALTLLGHHPCIREYVAMARSGDRLISQGYVAFCLYQFSMVAEDAVVKEFFDLAAGKLTSTLGDPDKPTPEQEVHPIFRLRERWLKSERNCSLPAPMGLEGVALIIKAWNYWRTGKTTGALSWRDHEDFPEVTPGPKNETNQKFMNPEELGREFS